ncbi:Transglycosylase SLT domain protein [Marinibacterium anthonyi]|nr:Transglycosylase SLT domain protein [Marinibacterium anthonyi]
MQPWPWAVNVSGEGYWFDDEDAALAFAFRQHKNGVRNFDVGCFQINYRWHGDAFVSIEDMFDPEANALYAARFLAELHHEFGEWEGAAGAYHSRTKEFADRYKVRFRQVHNALEPPLVADLGSRQRSPASAGSLIGASLGGRRMPGSVVAMPDAHAAFIPFD